MTGLLARLFGGQIHPDGGSTVLEEPITGITPARLAAASLPDNMSIGAVAGAIADMSGRRNQTLMGEVILREALAEKLLHGWLQNRHQTLYPLTLNFRTLTAEQRLILVRMMAIGFHAGSIRTDQAAARRWLASVGAEPDTLAGFDTALTAPSPLSTTIQAAIDADIAAYAYVVVLIGVDTHAEVGQRFLDYLAARLALPSPVVRSANRRYRH